MKNRQAEAQARIGLLGFQKNILFLKNQGGLYLLQPEQIRFQLHGR
jgi:hypothetical protein